MLSLNGAELIRRFAFDAVFGMVRRPVAFGRKSKIWSWIIPLAILIVAAFLGWHFRPKRENRYDAQILAAAERYRLDPAVIKAVIWQESKFVPFVRGRAGEIGLMQIREAAAFEWADAEKIHPFEHERILDPATNIMCGSFYLSKLLKRYERTDNPLPYALADYNAGRTHVLRWNKGQAQTNASAFLARMDFPGTRRYASNVIARADQYRPQFEKRRVP
jgi:soluble lytic murein transglycosylase